MIAAGASSLGKPLSKLCHEIGRSERCAQDSRESIP
jgi:hypothetical protein